MGMSGALWIAGQTCLRGGAGLVTLALPESLQPSLSVAIPCAMTIGLHESGTVSLGGNNCVRRSIKTVFSRSSRARTFARDRRFGLEVLAGMATSRNFRCRCSQRVGHRLRKTLKEPFQFERVSHSDSAPREWARLVGNKSHGVSENRRLAREIATRCNSVVVLKGNRTWITDGHRYFENTTGNPSLAVGGSGDALTGLITAIVCQGMDPMEAACLGAYLHGLAADLAHDSLGTPAPWRQIFSNISLQHFARLTIRFKARTNITSKKDDVD